MSLQPALSSLVVRSVGKLDDAPRRERREKLRERGDEPSFSRKLRQAIERVGTPRVDVKV